jgi:hypothetical protein
LRIHRIVLGQQDAPHGVGFRSQTRRSACLRAGVRSEAFSMRARKYSSRRRSARSARRRRSLRARDQAVDNSKNQKATGSHFIFDFCLLFDFFKLP